MRIGDTLRLTGTGMCNIRTPGSWSAKEDSPFLPFDCSQIVWNDAPPLPLPESDIVSKATALMQSVQRQLHPETDDDSRVSPALRSAIQKSGMVLLDDFGDIVQKTNDLCSAKDDCLRLKNALVNLGNTRNWETLTKRATAGKLDGVNVLLRPVSAESLENLVTTSTAPFVIRETSRAAQALNSPAPGGFLIASDEGSVLVNQPWPAVSLYDYPAHEQWGELRRLAGMLMHTPSMPKVSLPTCLLTPTARSISTCIASPTAAACGVIWASPCCCFQWWGAWLTTPFRPCVVINAIVSVWKRFRNITKAALIRFCSPHLTRKINFPGDRV